MGNVIDLAGWKADRGKVQVRYVDSVESMTRDQLIALHAGLLPPAAYLEDGSRLVDPAIFECDRPND